MTTAHDLTASTKPIGPPGLSLPVMSWACLLATGGIVLFPLSCTWSYISNYSFGWWVPFLALILFAERWEKRPPPLPLGKKSRIGPFILAWGVLFFCLRMALEVSLVARPLVLGCALLYVVALLYWLYLYGGTPWARYFAFPVCFLLLSVPWPLQIENPLVQGLAPFNAWLVAHCLIDFGIFAQASGQVIVLPNCTLGVKEACSGLRSLQAALMIAFLIGELYRFSWPRRIRIILLALALALFGNFLRTLFLALIAFSHGVSAMTQWHDRAGAFILVFTSVTTFLVAYFLHRQDPKPLPRKEASPSPGFKPNESIALRWACGILLASILVEVSTQSWYAWRQVSADHYPTWTVQLGKPNKFHEVAVDEESRDILKYDTGRQIVWQDDQGWSWTVYWFLYHEKPWAVSAFTNHNPDKCFPAVGYKTVKDYDPFTQEINGITLRIYPKQFSWNESPVYVFWVVYSNRATFPLEEAMGPSNDGLFAKGLFYLSSIWYGKRGSTAETESLETILAGPDTYERARAAYLVQLRKLIVPDP